MIRSDNSFPYHQYKGIKFETIATEEYEDDDYNLYMSQVDYCEDMNLYRVTHFLNGHWNGDVIFNGYEKEN